MRVFYHYDEHTKIFTRSSQTLTATTRYESLIDSVQDFVTHATRRDVFLIPEKNFAYFSFVCHYAAWNEFKREDEKRFVWEKIAYIKANYAIDSWCIHYEIAHCSVDWSPVQHVLWRTWELTFTIHCALLLPEIDYLVRWLRQSIGNRAPHVYPRSFFTRLYLMHHVQRKNYFLLDIWEQWTHLFQIEGWRYKQIEYINRWIKDLKTLYREHGIQEYFYSQSYDGVFVTTTINDINRTFVYYLLQRLQQFVTLKADVIMMWWATINPSCVDMIAQKYTEQFQWFLLPFHHAEGMKSLPRYSRKADELHAACAYMCSIPW
jgi:hypothetical protein